MMAVDTFISFSYMKIIIQMKKAIDLYYTPFSQAKNSINLFFKRFLLFVTESTSTIVLRPSKKLITLIILLSCLVLLSISSYTVFFFIIIIFLLFEMHCLPNNTNEMQNLLKSTGMPFL